MEAYRSLAEVADPAVSDTPGVFASFFGPDPLGLLFVVLLTSFGTWGLPQMGEKFYAIRSEKAIDKGTIISTVFAAIVGKGIWNRRRGKHACSCGDSCGGCACAGMCHPQPVKKSRPSGQT